MSLPPPTCPACGSSDTLPFASEDPESTAPPAAEVMLATLLFFLSLFAILVFFLLSRAGFPALVLLAAILFLFWRRRRERVRLAPERPQHYVCMDCSRNFKAP